MNAKKGAFISAGLLFFFLMCPGQEDELLKVESAINPRKLIRGQEGKVSLKLSIKEGIRISPQPDLIIEFNPVEDIVFPKNFFTASDLNIEILEEKGENFLNLSKPIEIPFTISPQARRGSHILEGRIKYFARSKTEGWCLKSNAKFSAAFSVSPAAVKKS
jgi:hypothetical protein